MPARPANIRVLAADGQLISNRGAIGGETVSLSALPAYVGQAVLAIEDKRFYSHFGIDPIGLAAAALGNVRAQRVERGGSTLTQQLAKNLFLSPEQTFARKAQEALLALWLERAYSKDEILEMYLNRVYFGGGAHGVEAAAQTSFGKPAVQLTIGEAALLAGLVKAPSRLNPKTNPEGADARAALVLAEMVREGFIAEKAAVTASNAVVTPRIVAETAMRMAISSRMDEVPSIALGTSEVSLLELTTAYAPFANGGIGVIANVIERIETSTGEVLYQNPSIGPGQVITPSIAATMNDMLQTSWRQTSKRPPQIAGMPVGGKTGTSQQGRDALFVGYTPQLVTGVWLGNDDDGATNLSGGNVPLDAWYAFMLGAH